MKIDCGEFFLRPLEIEDAGDLAKNANNRNVWINLRDVFPHPYSKNDAMNFIEFVQAADTMLVLGIMYKNECIGVIGAHFQPDVYQHSVELGFWIGETYWGKGIMTKACREYLKYLFEKKDINRIYSSVFEWNKSSMRVLEKCGFKKEGILRKAVLKDGNFIDEHRYSKLKND